MPGRVPPLHVPSTMGDRVLHHPEVAVALMAAAAGAGIAVEALLHTSALVRIPWLLGLPIGIVLALAGTIAALGILHPRLSHIEQHGWHILITASIVLATILTYSHPYCLVWWLALQWAAVGSIRSMALAAKRASDRRIHAASQAGTGA